MKQRGILLALIFLVGFIMLGCRENSKKTVVKLEKPVFYQTLTSESDIINGINYSLGDEGLAVGLDASPSYIKLNVEGDSFTHLNISFWLKNTKKDQTKPQIILSLIDTINKENRFSIWMAGYRLTGAINDINFWAKEYDYKLGMSSEYYDLYLLEQGKYYFFSLNVSPHSVEIYVNAELYAQYKVDIEDINFQNVLLGMEYRNGIFENQMQGFIRNLSIFDKTLTQDEIYSLSLETFYEIEKYNIDYELSKFKFD